MPGKFRSTCSSMISTSVSSSEIEKSAFMWRMQHYPFPLEQSRFNVRRWTETCRIAPSALDYNYWILLRGARGSKSVGTSGNPITRTPSLGFCNAPMDHCC